MEKWNIQESKKGVERNRKIVKTRIQADKQSATRNSKASYQGEGQ